MNKFILIILFLFAAPLHAQWYYWGQKYCWGCCHYMDPTIATHDGIPYGYVDNINYPDTYALPLNRRFKPPCRCGSHNYQYLRNCMHLNGCFFKRNSN